MATPAWVRRHRTERHHTVTLALTELTLQAEDRIEIEHDTADLDWTPRRGMSFASE